MKQASKKITFKYLGDRLGYGDKASLEREVEHARRSLSAKKGSTRATQASRVHFTNVKER
jgi:hypothetical protein